MSAVITKLIDRGGPPLPETDIESALRRWWQSEVQKGVDDPFAKQKETAGTLYDVLVEVDSLSVVGVLAELGTLVGFKVPPRLIKRGGYTNCDEMVNHLLKGLRDCARRGTTPLPKKEKKYVV
jgi:hypothetical protein